MFTDVEFMTAKDKALTLKAWKTFLKNGCQHAHFTKRLYSHIICHCSFIAHYSLSGFYSTYFMDTEKAMMFLHQWDRDRGNISTELGWSTWLQTEEYADLNKAMIDFYMENRGDIIYRTLTRINGVEGPGEDYM